MVTTDGIVEVHSTSHSFPSGTDAKVAYGLMAAARSGGRAVSGRIFLLRSVFNPKTLPLPATRLKGIRQRKQATGRKSEHIEERLTDEARY